MGLLPEPGVGVGGSGAPSDGSQSVASRVGGSGAGSPAERKKLLEGVALTAEVNSFPSSVTRIATNIVFLVSHLVPIFFL